MSTTAEPTTAEERKARLNEIACCCGADAGDKEPCDGCDCWWDSRLIAQVEQLERERDAWHSDFDAENYRANCIEAKLEERHLQCKSIVEESDEWKRIAQGTSDGRRLSELGGERDELRKANGEVGLMWAETEERMNEALALLEAEGHSGDEFDRLSGKEYHALCDQCDFLGKLRVLANETHKEKP